MDGAVTGSLVDVVIVIDANGWTRSVLLVPYEPQGLLRRGSGRVDGVYGTDMLAVDVGVWLRLGAALILACE